MRYVTKKKCLYVVFVIITVFIILHPGVNKRRSYEFIEKRNILTSLHREIAENFTSTAYADCDYQYIIFDDTTLPATIIDGDLNEGYRIKEGGEYAPNECKSLFSTAVIVPYRDRAEMLRSFLVYMHSFLRRQHIHYRIYVVEQVDSQPFNRAKLINIGALTAMSAGYPCLIFHDVDMLPLKPANIYACSKRPRLMSSNTNSFRFIWPHLKNNNGAVSILGNQFRNINGMSNKYFGLSGEDDDFYMRLKSKNIKLCSFEPITSSYHQIPHSPNLHPRKHKIIFTKVGMTEDGLSTLKYTEVATVLHPLFTHIMVDL